MNKLLCKPLYKLSKPCNKQQGFTLIELIVVIILLGVTSLGIARILSLATQSYVNSADRDQLINSARFAIERLNREIPEALPNSIRNFSVIENNNTIECIEFVPIIGSSIYLDLSNTLTNQFDIVAFNNTDRTSGICSESCGNVAIYTLSNSDVYIDPQAQRGQLFAINTIATTTITDVWQVTLNNTVSVDVLSPTERVYFVDQPVRYCVDNKQLFRIADYNIAENLTLSMLPANNSTQVLMADNIIDVNFLIQEASLTSNASVFVDLTFQSNIDSSEVIPFNHEISLLNTP